MANSEIKEALRNAANTVTKYLRNAAVLEVETKLKEVGATGDPTLAASTAISLDGDNTSVIPGVKNEAGKWEIDTTLYDLHVQNVKSAIEYRRQMMDAMLGLFR
ncbi:MAG: hypothetical protein AAGF11_12660 [Myxococcota bacterium]